MNSTRSHSTKLLRSNQLGFSDLLNYDHFADDGVIYNSDGSFQQSFWYHGNDFDSADDHYTTSVTNYLNLVFASFETGWVIHINNIRIQNNEYIDENQCYFKNETLNLIDRERRFFFTKSQGLFKNLTAITFTYLPQSRLFAKLGQKFVFTNKITKKKNSYKVTLEYFKNRLDQVVRLLNRALNLTSMNSDETITYLNYIITGKYIKRRLPLGSFVELRHYLSADFIGGFEPKIGSKNIRVISVDDQFPDDSYPRILERLNQLGFEFRWNTRFFFITNLQAQKNISFLADLHYQEIEGIKGAVASHVGMGADGKINRSNLDLFNEAEEARRNGALLGVNYGKYSCTIVLYNDNEELLSEQVKQVENLLNEMMFKTRLETLNAVPAFLGTLDGNIYDNNRKFLVSTENLSELIPISGEWSGHAIHPSNLFKQDSPSLFYADTNSYSLYKGVLHWHDVGHTLVVGATGSGKSTLICFLATSHMRYENAQLFVFDNKRSLMPLTYAVDGQHFDLGVDSVAFQPFADIDTVKGFDFALDWVIIICELNYLNVSADHLNAISSALRGLSVLAKEYRTISGLYKQVCGVNEDVAKVFEGYISKDSMKGIIFAANEDNIVFSNWNVFELSEVMSKGDATLIPVLKYLFYKIMSRLDGRPTMIIIEEAWMAFNNPVFSKELVHWLKTFRKLNVYIILVTVNIQDVINSSMKDTLLQECVTKIFTPNPQLKNAEIAESYSKLMLSQKQIDILANATVKREYYLVHQDGNKLINVDMDNFTFAKAFFCRISIDDLKKAKQLKIDNPNIFVSKWLNYCGLSDYAEKL